MKTIILFSHSYFAQSKANAALLKSVEGNADFEIRNLNALYPDYKINVGAEVAALKAADKIAIQFPLFWYSSPAIFKAWQDDVLTQFYASAASPLKGKSVAFVVTIGGTKENYQSEDSSEFSALERFLFPQTLTLQNCGANVKNPLLFFGVMNGAAVSPEKYLQFLNNF